MNTATDSLAVKLPVTGSQPAAMTAQLTTITYSEPGTPDYAIQAPTNSSPYGFVTADEARSLLKVVANLQVRLLEVEAILEGLNAVDAN
ncbi:MAG: hypothetical protein IPJ84_18900 [Bdellovibrionales bacterium]|nr:hypothetical protein [Bdellovibrionales bacterium]